MKSQPIIEIEVNRNNIYPYILRQEKIPDKKGKKDQLCIKNCLQLGHPKNIAEEKEE